MASSVACVSIGGPVKELCREALGRPIRSCAYVFPLGCGNRSINPRRVIRRLKHSIRKSGEGAGGCHAIRQPATMRDRPMVIETRPREVTALGRSLAMSSGTRATPAAWLLCRAASHHFALPMQHVIETMRMLPVEKVV